MARQGCPSATGKKRNCAPMVALQSGDERELTGNGRPPLWRYEEGWRPRGPFLLRARKERLRVRPLRGTSLQRSLGRFKALCWGQWSRSSGEERASALELFKHATRALRPTPEN